MEHIINVIRPALNVSNIAHLQFLAISSLHLNLYGVDAISRSEILNHHLMCRRFEGHLVSRHLIAIHKDALVLKTFNRNLDRHTFRVRNRKAQQMKSGLLTTCRHNTSNSHITLLRQFETKRCVEKFLDIKLV